MDGIKNIFSKSVIFLLLTLAAVIFCLPILQNINNWGINDWDQHMFWQALPRLSILKYFEFPFWDPYANGGNVYFAHPHSSFLSPFFITTILLGAVVGFKINIIICFFIGLLGTYYLIKKLGGSSLGGVLAGFVFMFNPYLSLHTAEGNGYYIYMCVLPWLLYFCIGALSDWRKAVFVVLGLVLMQFSGCIDVFSAGVFFMFIFSVFESIRAKSIRPVFLCCLIIIFTFLLGAIKFLPVYLFSNSCPRPIDDQQGIGFNFLYKMFLDRNQVGAFLESFKNTVVELDPSYIKKYGLLSGWASYGFYVGYLPAVLFVTGIFLLIKKRWTLVSAGFISFFILMGDKSPFKFIWDILHAFPVYSNLRPCSGHAACFLLVFGVIVGLCFSKFESLLDKKSTMVGILIRKLFLRVVVVLVFIDLTLVSWPILKCTFTVKPFAPTRSEKFHHIKEFIGFDDRLSRSAMYPSLLANTGELNSYEVISVKQSKYLKYYDDRHFYDNWLFCNDSAKGEWTKYNPEFGIAGSYLFFDFTKTSNMKLYLKSFIYSPSSKAIKITVGRDAGLKILVNGQNIFEAQYANKVRDSESILVDLEKGYNEIVMELTRSNISDELRLIISIPREIVSNKNIEGIFYSTQKNVPVPLGAASEVFLVNGAGEVEILKWSINKVIVRASLQKDDTIVLNQNYCKGWHVKGCSKSRVLGWNGLVASNLPRGVYTLEFYYIVEGFYAGLVISFVTGLLVILILFFFRKRGNRVRFKK